MELEAALDSEVEQYRGAAFAKSTQKSYATHRRSFLTFCFECGYNPVPVQPEVLQRYVAYLARKLKFSSLKQYLNIIRFMQLEQGLPNPLEENHWLQLLLRGVRRVKGDSTTRKLPITPLLLLKIRSVLDLQDPNSTVFWAACLTTFFGMLRRSNVLPTPPFSDTKHLRREDVLAYSWGLALKIRWSKTIQFRESEAGFESVISLPLVAETCMSDGISLGAS